MRNNTYPSDPLSFSVDFSLTQIADKVVLLIFGKVQISVKNQNDLFFIQNIK